MFMKCDKTFDKIFTFFRLSCLWIYVNILSELLFNLKFSNLRFLGRIRRFNIAFYLTLKYLICGGIFTFTLLIWSRCV